MKTRLTLGLPQLPAGQVTQDEYFGEVTSIEHDFQSAVPVLQVARDTHDLELLVSYRGARKAGLCYPPMTRTLVVDFNPDLGTGMPLTGSNGSAAGDSGFQSEQDRLAGLLASGKLWLTVASFFWPGGPAGLHALRVSDDPHPLQHHRRAGRRGLDIQGVLTVAGLRACHVRRLYRCGNRRWPVR